MSLQCVYGVGVERFASGYRTVGAVLVGFPGDGKCGRTERTRGRDVWKGGAIHVATCLLRGC